MWTRFFDISSGGTEKTSWSIILIEAPEPQARDIFGARFHIDPDAISCECCGPDFSVTESETLPEVTETTLILRAPDYALPQPPG